MNTGQRKRAAQREADIADWAWQTFARTYPHEAYATWPDRFLRYARLEAQRLHSTETGLTDAQILTALKNTAGAR